MLVSKSGTANNVTRLQDAAERPRKCVSAGWFDIQMRQIPVIDSPCA